MTGRGILAADDLGEACLILGDDTLDARPGTFVRMPAGLRHAVRAKAPTVMLLLLLKG